MPVQKGAIQPTTLLKPEVTAFLSDEFENEWRTYSLRFLSPFRLGLSLSVGQKIAT